MFLLPLFRYKLDIKVVDETNMATFIILGAKAEKMVNEAASTLVERILLRVSANSYWTCMQQIDDRHVSMVSKVSESHTLLIKFYASIHYLLNPYLNFA